MLDFSAQNAQKLFSASQLQVSQGFKYVSYMRKKYFRIRKEWSLVINTDEIKYFSVTQGQV